MSVCVCVTVCVPGDKYMPVGRGEVGVEREKEGGGAGKRSNRYFNMNIKSYLE